MPLVEDEGSSLYSKGTRTVDHLEQLALYEEAYAHSHLVSMFRSQNLRGIKRTAGISDIEGSWWLEGQEEDAAYLELAARVNDIPVIAITGLSMEQYLGLHQKGKLPAYPAVGTSTGAEIFVQQHDGSYVRDMLYEEIVGNEVFWNRRDVLLQSRQMYRAMRTDALMARAGIEWQNWEKERKYLAGESDDIDENRVCFYFYANSLQERNRVEDVARSFFPGCEKWIVITEERHHNQQLAPGATRRKYCLDINRLAKLDAANYFINMFGIQQGIVVGDGGNDIYQLRDTENLVAVVTGTGREELVSNLKDPRVTVRERYRSRGREHPFRTIRTAHGHTKEAYIEQDQSKQAVLSVYHASRLLIREMLRRDRISETPLLNEDQRTYWRRVYTDILRGERGYLEARMEQHLRRDLMHQLMTLMNTRL